MTKILFETRVIREWGPEDWEQYKAYWPSAAAEMAMDDYEQDDRYLIRSRDTMIVEVREAGKKETLRFKVWGEAVPRYMAVPDPIPPDHT